MATLQTLRTSLRKSFFCQSVTLCQANLSKTATIMGKDHLEVTKNVDRYLEVHSAKVVKMTDLSPTVKELILQVRKSKEGKNFSFLPGQWVDTFLPGVDKVGGFSITSTPKEMKEKQQIKLAVKHSYWPPARWIHEKCHEGATVQIRGGGDFVLAEPFPDSLLFIAGGVGINPIASMFLHLNETNFGGNVNLLFSARNPDELIFKDELDAVSTSRSNFHVRYFTTKNNQCDNKEIITRRFIAEDLLRVTTVKTTIFVCGPPQMIQFVLGSNLPCAQVKYENWWT